MSFTDKLVLWLHIGFAIFALGPVTIAVLSTPRYIRARNQVVVSYLLRTTRLYALVSLGVLVFGVVAAQQRKDFSHPWLTIAMTLFIVSLVLLLLIMRDQRHAVTALELAAAAEAPAVGGPVPDAAEEAARDAATASDRAPAPAGTPGSPGTPGAEPSPVASVERGRIATMGGVTALLYLVILVLMVWR
jgi:hypothetical protein